MLKGSARWISADANAVVLGDVTPRDGYVVLSLHYQVGLTASPARVEVQEEIDPHDPIRFVRLYVTDPVARVTLTRGRH